MMRVMFICAVCAACVVSSCSPTKYLEKKLVGEPIATGIDEAKKLSRRESDCPKTQQYDPETNRCIDVQRGRFADDRARDCAPGEFYDPVRLMCYRPACLHGEAYDVRSGRCVRY